MTAVTDAGKTASLLGRLNLHFITMRPYTRNKQQVPPLRHRWRSGSGQNDNE
ncbi:MAG: hypothetical protein WBM24_19350 [Candidatus Sulfotelmatobacter sp.]